MRSTMTRAALAASLLLPAMEAQAQIFNRGQAPKTDPATKPASNANSTAPNQIAPGVLPSNAELPPPTNPEDLKPTMPLPTGPIEPYLLTKEQGPFMVLAHTFRGPEAPRQALALVLELREKYQLPAYILLPKKFPGRSMIRGVPPETPPFVTKDDVALPELLRTLDEAAVLVGNEKTTKDAFDLLHKVKKLKVVCLDGETQMWQFRKGKGLSRAIQTTNPFIPAEELFARQPDVMLVQINEGPNNIRNCPGRYTLPVATFQGRSAFVDSKDTGSKLKALVAEKSPLATAADDAERLAAALTKDREIQKLGVQAYVYHDRTSSRVTIGSFNAPNDPNAKRVHDRLLEIASDLNNRRVSDTMIVPAGYLLDLDTIRPKITQAQSSSKPMARQ